MELFQGRYFGEYERNAVATQQRMLEDAKERISAAKPVMGRLMLMKLKTLLSHDEGGVFYAMESLSGRQYGICCLLSNIWYYFVCMFAVYGIWRMERKQERGSVLVTVLFAIGLILAQLLVEVAARYHYALIPILLIMAAYAFQNMTLDSE
jgi:FtsH-binding integral membrane protein